MYIKNELKEHTPRNSTIHNTFYQKIQTEFKLFSNFFISVYLPENEI